MRKTGLEANHFLPHPRHSGHLGRSRNACRGSVKGREPSRVPSTDTGRSRKPGVVNNQKGKTSFSNLLRRFESCQFAGKSSQAVAGQNQPIVTCHIGLKIPGSGTLQVMAQLRVNRQQRITSLRGRLSIRRRSNTRPSPRCPDARGFPRIAMPPLPALPLRVRPRARAATFP